MTYRLLLALWWLFLPIFSYAQEVKVISKGEGATRDKAVHSALREALERTFNSFISSSTYFANDEIVSDEIVSITRGNILKYEVVYERIDTLTQMHNVMVESIVSLDKFKNYSKSHGSSVEIDGAAVANSLIANEAMKRFNAENEVVAIKNFVFEMEQICKHIFDYQIKVKLPTDTYSNIVLSVTVETNFNFIKSIDKLFDMLVRLSNNQGNFIYVMPSFRGSTLQQNEEMAKLLIASKFRKDEETDEKKNNKISKIKNDISHSKQMSCPACGSKSFVRLDRYSYTHHPAIGQCNSRKCGYKVTPEEWRTFLKFLSQSHRFRFLKSESVELLKKYIGYQDYGPIWNTKYKIVDNNGKVYEIKEVKLSNELIPPQKLHYATKVSTINLKDVKSFSIEPIFESAEQKLENEQKTKMMKKKKEHNRLKQMQQSAGSPVRYYFLN